LNFIAQTFYRRADRLDFCIGLVRGERDLLAHIGIVALGKGFLNVPLATFSLQPRSGAVG